MKSLLVFVRSSITLQTTYLVSYIPVDSFLGVAFGNNGNCLPLRYFARHLSADVAVRCSTYLSLKC